MNANKARGCIIALELLALLVLAAVHNRLLALLLSAAVLLSSIFILYGNLGVLTDLSPDNPKMKTLKLATVFDGIVMLSCVLWAVLTRLGILNVSQRGEEYFAAFIISAVILFSGVIAPKLPFSRHTGLRLPWTVADEETWIVAHRILGYTSLPLALFYIMAVPVTDHFGALTLTVAALWVGIPGGLSLLFYQRKMKGTL